MHNFYHVAINLGKAHNIPVSMNYLRVNYFFIKRCFLKLKAFSQGKYILYMQTQFMFIQM